MLINQTIEKQKYKTYEVILTLVFALLLFNGVDRLLMGFSPLIRSVGSLVSLAFVAGLNYQLIYYKLATYHYKVIADDVIIERVVGRSNHAFIAIKVDQIIGFAPLTDEKIPKRDYFVHKSSKKKPYVLTLMVSKKKRKIVIEPDVKMHTFFMNLVYGEDKQHVTY